ncbi:MAG: hypothetical protein AVDCRST_MAG76-1874, partial [uncultured Acidimicrobiales bacterium]
GPGDGTVATDGGRAEPGDPGDGQGAPGRPGRGAGDRRPAPAGCEAHTAQGRVVRPLAVRRRRGAALQRHRPAGRTRPAGHRRRGVGRPGLRAALRRGGAGRAGRPCDELGPGRVAHHRPAQHDVGPTWRGFVSVLGGRLGPGSARGHRRETGRGAGARVPGAARGPPRRGGQDQDDRRPGPGTFPSEPPRLAEDHGAGGGTRCPAGLWDRPAPASRRRGHGHGAGGPRRADRRADAPGFLHRHPGSPLRGGRPSPRDPGQGHTGGPRADPDPLVRPPVVSPRSRQPARAGGRLPVPPGVGALARPARPPVLASGPAGGGRRLPQHLSAGQARQL